jgi:hypothetical protein
MLAFMEVPVTMLRARVELSVCSEVSAGERSDLLHSSHIVRLHVMHADERARRDSRAQKNRPRIIKQNISEMGLFISRSGATERNTFDINIFLAC